MDRTQHRAPPWGNVGTCSRSEDDYGGDAAGRGGYRRRAMGQPMHDVHHADGRSRLAMQQDHGVTSFPFKMKNRD